MKYGRHKCLIEIINKYKVETQDELLLYLKQEGYDVTQATISRDIKELKIIKVSTENDKYKYAVPAQEDVRATAKYENIISETVISVDYANNMIVIKTYPGMANAAGAAIDSMSWKEILGTIAGDDTIFAVTYSSDQARFFVEKFKKYLN